MVEVVQSPELREAEADSEGPGCSELREADSEGPGCSELRETGESLYEALLEGSSTPGVEDEGTSE